MKRSEVKDILDLITCSLDEFQRLEKDKEIEPERLNISIELKGVSAIKFRDLIQASKMIKGDQGELLRLTIEAGILECHKVMSDKISSVVENSSTSIKSIEINSESDFQGLIDKLRANGKNKMADFIEKKHREKGNA